MSTVSWKYPALEEVTLGADAPEGVWAQAQRRTSLRVVLLTSRSVAKSRFFERIADRLGDRLTGSFQGISSRSPLPDILAATEAARAARADLVVAVGGGSVIDAAKLVLLCLRHGITRPAELDEYQHLRPAGNPSERPGDAGLWLPLVAVPTTLSAAEFTWWAGTFDPARQTKQAYGHPMMMPRAILLDPAATHTAPLDLLLPTGLKAIDHAAEFIATRRPEALSTARSTEALRLLARGLREVHGDTASMAARQLCQTGMALAMAGPSTGVGVGASHAIGHALGSRGIAHGLTSCTVLPAVMRWNRPANADRQALISDAMGRPGEDTGDVLEEFIGELHLPARLRELDIPHAELPAIAAEALTDRVIRGNPREIGGASDVLEILELAW